MQQRPIECPLPLGIVPGAKEIPISTQDQDAYWLAGNISNCADNYNKAGIFNIESTETLKGSMDSIKPLKLYARFTAHSSSGRSTAFSRFSQRPLIQEG